MFRLGYSAQSCPRNFPEASRSKALLASGDSRSVGIAEFHSQSEQIQPRNSGSATHTMERAIVTPRQFVVFPLRGMDDSKRFPAAVANCSDKITCEGLVAGLLWADGAGLPRSSFFSLRVTIPPCERV